MFTSAGHRPAREFIWKTFPWRRRRARVFCTSLWIWLKFSDACIAAPTRWAVEMAWTPRRAQSLSWATAESERGSGRGGELEKPSVSVIGRERMLPKNPIILSFRSYYISLPLTQLLTSWLCKSQQQKKKVDRHVWKKKGPRGSRETRRFSEEWRKNEGRKKWISSLYVLPNNCPSSVSWVQLRFTVRGCFPLGSHTPVLYDDYSLSGDTSGLWNIRGKPFAAIVEI